MKNNLLVTRYAEKLKQKLLLFGFQEEEILTIFLLIDKTIYQHVITEIIDAFPDEKQKDLAEKTEHMTDPVQLAKLLEINEKDIIQRYISFLEKYIADIFDIC